LYYKNVPLKTLFLSILLLIIKFSISFGQAWNWAKEEIMCGDPEGFGNFINADDSGNIYFAVSSHSGPISLSKFDNNGNFIWTEVGAHYAYGSPQFVKIFSNNEYWAGNFGQNYIVFGADTLTAVNSTSDVFIAKFNSNGTTRWAKQSKSVESGGIGTAYSIATDGFGDVYITGTMDGNIAFDADTLKLPWSGAFLVKYNTTGNVLWAKNDTSVSSYYTVDALSVSADNNGNSYVGGHYVGSIIFDKDTLPLTPVTKMNAFLVKFDPNGNVLWAWSPAMPTDWGKSTINSVSSDGYGNVYVTGTFSKGTISFGSYLLGPASRITPFLAKFNPGGNISWAQQAYELDNNAWSASSVAIDNFNNGYILMENSGSNNSLSIKLGDDTIQFNSGGFFADALMQFDSAGSVKCGTMFREGMEDDGDAICVSPSGQYVYVAGDVDELSEAIVGIDTLKNSSNNAEYSFIGNWQPCNNINEGINEVKGESEKVKVYPNPSNGVFTIALVGAQNFVPATIEVYNVMGEKVLTEILHSVQDDKVINLTEQPSGVYLYRVIAEDGSLVGEGKMVIQK
jgi:hypothetical protein